MTIFGSVNLSFCQEHWHKFPDVRHKRKPKMFIHWFIGPYNVYRKVKICSATKKMTVTMLIYGSIMFSVRRTAVQTTTLGDLSDHFLDYFDINFSAITQEPGEQQANAEEDVVPSDSRKTGQLNQSSQGNHQGSFTTRAGRGV
ncbi:hypothetical protein DAPPUDRAFT_326837 [Daphnia pulex]|uniref:Uncharacterized protein n=1 Tax=Daphnia pulex TaxID=6669 RepID=E9H8X5_DAPPU|nr:hypothetical protein DAPPUDRAFT_326837 [Daphnia pulex]|eukprot:EFX71799.1 hypothetical protein DAPPUDRAFT_326837 [Daphnia pulex]